VEYDHQPGFVRVHHVSDWNWWACHGGVEKMQAEADKCTPRCAVCHGKQKTHSIFKPAYAKLEDYPTDTPKEREAKVAQAGEPYRLP